MVKLLRYLKNLDKLQQYGIKRKIKALRFAINPPYEIYGFTESIKINGIWLRVMICRIIV